MVAALFTGHPSCDGAFKVYVLLANCWICSYLVSYIHVRLSLMFNKPGEITVAWLRYLNYHIGYLFLPYQISEVLVLLAHKMVDHSDMLSTAFIEPIGSQDATYNLTSTSNRQLISYFMVGQEDNTNPGPSQNLLHIRPFSAERLLISTTVLFLRAILYRCSLYIVCSLRLWVVPEWATRLARFRWASLFMVQANQYLLDCHLHGSS